MRQKKVFLHIFLMIFLVVVLLGASWAEFFSAVSLGASVSPNHITLTWTGDPRTTQTITWKTETFVSTGQVQYLEAVAGHSFPHNAAMTAAAAERFSTHLGDINIHSVTLTGLKPGTRYLYRVGDGTSWSETKTFATSPAGVRSFKFLVFGDSQSVNYDVWRAALQQAYQANPDAVFFTNVGDLVDVGQDCAQWNAWFDAGQGVIDAIVAMPVTGNHEAYTPERRFSMPVYFTAQFKLPANGPVELQGQVYSFDYGDVHFVVLDSQESELKGFIPAILDRQKEWLAKDLANTAKKWKVVFIHRPPYNNKPGGTNENIRTAFVPILDKYRVDVVFSGHDHAYARTYPLRGDTVADSPAAGTIYVATGRSGTKKYKDILSKDWNEFFYNPWDEPNYLTVEVRDDTLKVQAFKLSGGLIDVWTIDKTAGRK